MEELKDLQTTMNTDSMEDLFDDECVVEETEEVDEDEHED